MFTLLPSIFAIVVKLWLLWFGRDALKKQRNLLFFFIALFVLNIGELALLMMVGSEAAPMPWLQAYYIGTVLSAAGFVIVANELSGLNWRFIKPLYALLVPLISSLFLFTDLIISGVSTLSYSFVRIPGSEYWIFQVYVLMSLPGALAMLIWGRSKGGSVMERKRSTVVMVGAAPGVISAVLIVALMALGYPINATVWLSAMICFLLMAMIWSETTEGVFGILSKVPFTSEWRTHQVVTEEVNRLMAGISNNCVEDSSLKSRLRVIEAELVRMAYEECGRDKTAAASSLDISISSLHRKLRG